MGDVVVGGAGGVVGGAKEVDWGGAREVVWGSAREMYPLCDWSKYKLKNLCCMLCLSCFYDTIIEINGCTHQPKLRSVWHTWESSWVSYYGWCKHEN